MDKFNLFKYAMTDQWEKVVEAYKENHEAQEHKITRNEDTGLHIAVAGGQTDIVSQLVGCLGENATKILSMQNKRGNTPLHLAAILGNVKMCKSIASTRPGLINVGNKENETPLLLAAHHGQEKAFICLHLLWKRSPEVKDSYYLPCRRKNGDTILHTAISGEYFRLASMIIKEYPDLVNSYNVDGFTPLHVLANKPSAFESGSHFGLFDRVIYHFSIVGELVEIADDQNNEDHDLKDTKDKSYENYPENYQTCVTFFKVLYKICKKLCVFFAKTLHIKRSGLICDEENPPRSVGTGNMASSAVESESSVVTEKVKRSTSNNGGNQTEENKETKFFPPNYDTEVLLFKLMINVLLIITGFGFEKIQKIQNKKVRHAWAVRVMNKLVKKASSYKYDDSTGKIADTKHDEYSISDLTAVKEDIDKNENAEEINKSEKAASAKGEVEKGKETDQNSQDSVNKETQTPMLIAAKMGVAEMVEKFLDTFPVSIQDLDSNQKNVVLLAVENRQPKIYNLLQSKAILKENVLRQVDDKGNGALHLAAMAGKHPPWLISGAALQMQWECKWYKFVKKSMPPNFFARHNNEGQTPKEVFKSTHQDLVKDGGKWLTKTSESCSVIAALNATVAFATSSQVPGGVDDKEGRPVLEGRAAFNLFAISALLALCFSVTALVFFLAIITSRFEEKDFRKVLPRRLLLGLSALFASIVSILVTFCSGHFYILKNDVRSYAYPIYVVMCLPVTIFALAQLSLYFDLVWTTFKNEPRSSHNKLR